VVEADEGSSTIGMTHDEAVLRQFSKKLSHQHAKIGFLSKIIGAGKSRIDAMPAERAAAPLRT